MNAIRISSDPAGIFTRRFVLVLVGLLVLESGPAE
jgi:hypothetical protein